MKKFFLLCACIPVICFAASQPLARGEEGGNREGENHLNQQQRNEVYQRGVERNDLNKVNGYGNNNGGNPVYVQPEDNQPAYYNPPQSY